MTQDCLIVPVRDYAEYRAYYVRHLLQKLLGVRIYCDTWIDWTYANADPREIVQVAWPVGCTFVAHPFERDYYRIVVDTYDRRFVGCYQEAASAAWEPVYCHGPRLRVAALEVVVHRDVKFYDARGTAFDDNWAGRLPYIYTAAISPRDDSPAACFIRDDRFDPPAIVYLPPQQQLAYDARPWFRFVARLAVPARSLVYGPDRRGGHVVTRPLDHHRSPIYELGVIMTGESGPAWLWRQEQQQGLVQPVPVDLPCFGAKNRRIRL